MILPILRIGFTGALLYVLYGAATGGALVVGAGDMGAANFMAQALILGIFTAVVWAPVIGERIAEPVTSVITDSTYVEDEYWGIQFIRWLEQRNFRRLTVFCCFFEGLNRPWMPAAFVIGLKNAQPDTLLERLFAQEVYRFNNAYNCLLAYQVLQRHRIDPGVHRQAEINIFICSLQRQEAPERSALALPTAGPAAKIKRNSNILLFEGVEELPTPVNTPPPEDTSPH